MRQGTDSLDRWKAGFVLRITGQVSPSQQREPPAMGMGKMMVLFCSAEIEFRVCRYRSYKNYCHQVSRIALYVWVCFLLVERVEKLG